MRRPIESAQYTSLVYGAYAKQSGIDLSMGSVGDPWDDALAESFFASQSRARRRETVQLDEIDPPARAPILQRYLQVAPGARARIPVDVRALLAEFEAIAEQHPVFRIRAESSTPL